VHPRLLDGLKRALNHSEWIEKFQPATRATFFYSGPESALRPEVVRFRKRLRNFKLDGRVLIRTQRQENEDDFDCVLEFKAPFGAYPVELKETYPFNAEVTDEPDYESLTVELQNTLALMEMNPEAEFTFVYQKEHPLMTQISQKATLTNYQ
jgi:7-cyano-7-deazaguanine tRNA-ribosyltransferase